MQTFRVLGALALGASAVAFLPTVAGTATSVVAPTSLSGNNAASWIPTLNVTMPAGALADDYSGTVTTSVL